MLTNANQNAAFVTLNEVRDARMQYMCPQAEQAKRLLNKESRQKVNMIMVTKEWLETFLLFSLSTVLTVIRNTSSHIKTGLP